MNRESKIYQQRNGELDLPSIIRALAHNWWVILLCGLLAGMWVFMAVDFLKKPVYVSQATLVISNNGNDTSVYTDSALEKVASQYQKILSSNTLKNTVQKELGVKNLPGTIQASVVPGTNLLLLSGVAGNPGEAYLLVKTAVQNYSKVSDYVISSFVLEVMKAPGIPTAASNGNQKKDLAVKGFLLGLAAAALVIAVFVFMRDDIKNENQVGRLLDTSLFAGLYFEKKARNAKKSSILISNPSTSFFYSENIRKLATKLDYRARKNGHKVLLITSVQENEGKSTIAANLALALAAKNRRVLLVDGDLRKPALNKIFDKTVTPEMEIGNLLTGKTTLQEALTRDRENGLYYLFGTRAYRNSDSLLSSGSMEETIRASRKVLDYIIVDSSPTCVSSDAEILAEYADAVLLTVRQCTSRVADINDTLDALRKCGVEVYGCVLNAIQTRFVPKSAEYGYSYGYGSYGRKYGRYRKYGSYGGYGKKAAQSGGETGADSRDGQNGN